MVYLQKEFLCNTDNEKTKANSAVTILRECQLNDIALLASSGVLQFPTNVRILLSITDSDVPHSASRFQLCAAVRWNQTLDTLLQLATESGFCARLAVCVLTCPSCEPIRSHRAYGVG
jgi:hypothetical protein